MTEFSWQVVYAHTHKKEKPQQTQALTNRNVSKGLLTEVQVTPKRLRHGKAHSVTGDGS